jgi:hypothetical protein
MLTHEALGPLKTASREEILASDTWAGALFRRGLGRGAKDAMVLRGDGTFAAGRAGCERYWTIRDERLLVAGYDGRLTMELVAATADGGVGGAVVGA